MNVATRLTHLPRQRLGPEGHTPDPAAAAGPMRGGAGAPDDLGPGRPRYRGWPGPAAVAVLFLVGVLLAVRAARSESVPLWALAVAALLVAVVLAGVVAFRRLPRRLYAALVVSAAAVMTVAGLVPVSTAVFRCDLASAGDDLSACDLSGKDFADRDLSAADLTGADLTRAVLTGVDLSDADLTRADLSGADISGADLSGVRLEDTVFEGADLSGVVLDGLSGSGSQLAGVSLNGASAVGADLSNSDLGDADLTGADLTGADLVATRLAGAELGNASLVDATMRGANLEGATLTGADLSGADLTGADLSPADVTGATLTGAELRNADLQDTTGLTDEMLADALGVQPQQLTAAVTLAGIRFGGLPGIERAVGEVVRTGNGLPEARTYTAGPGFHPIVVFDEGGYAEAPWLESAGGQWFPPGLRFTELVLTVDPAQQVVETRSYFYANGTFAHSIDRIRYNAVLTVLEAATGDVVATRTFYGSMPRALAHEESEFTYDVAGGPVDYTADAVPWLRRLVHPVQLD